MSFSRQRRSSLALVFCSCPVLCVVKSFIGNPAVGFGVNDLDFPSWLWLLGCIRPPGKILQEPGNSNLLYPRILLEALQDFTEEELLLFLFLLSLSLLYYFIILLYLYYFNDFYFIIFIIYFILLFLYYYFLLLCHHHCDTHAHGLIPIKPHPG